jgi:hypothetical protein
MSRLQERQAAVRAAKKIITPLQEHLPPPTQSQFNQLYKDIHEFMSGALREANRQGKKCVFVMGEIHQIILARNSLVVEKMFMLAAKQLGINTYIREGSDMGLMMKQTILVPMLREARAGSTEWDLAEVETHLLMDPLSKKFRIVSGETAGNEGVSDEERDRQIRVTITQQNQHALVRVGMQHLQGVSQKVAEKILTYPVNTVPAAHLTKIMAEMGDPSHAAPIIKFANDPKKTTPFAIAANLLSMNPDVLLAMADKAHVAFTSSLSSSSTAKVQEKLQEHANNAVLTPAPALSISTLAPTSRITSGVATLPSLAIAPTASSTVGPQYPIETVPLNELIRIGFWVASKLGFCAKPSSSPTPVTFSHSSLEKIHDENMREASAQQKLNAQGSSLEAALRDLFGKNYTEGDKAHQTKLKNFIVKVINGDVSLETGRKFNIISKIGNRHERAKQLDKLRRSMTGETRKAERRSERSGYSR